MKLKSPMEIWKYLPGTNCGECDEKTCLAFAALLKERSKDLADCKPLFADAQYAEKARRLTDLLAPEIRAVTIGTGSKALQIGGEDVMHRHELTFFNRTALAFDVWDTLDEAALRERVRRIADWRKFYVGDFLMIDAIVIRAVSGDAQTFATCVKRVAEETDLPLMLCSLDPVILEAGLKLVADRAPLLYAATKANWQTVLSLAKSFSVPVTVCSPNLDELASLATTFASAGLKDIVLDPGMFPTGEGLAASFANFVQIRRAGIVDGNDGVAYPLLAVPMTAWLINEQEDAIAASYWEAMLATIGIIKYADIMILHSIEPHSLIPVRTLAANIYTDPRRPVSVEPGLRVIGAPTPDSPLFITTNFALTYYTVESDLSSNKIDAFLMVADTDGIGVEASVAGEQLTADRIRETLELCEADSKVKHRTLVIPGLAARISGETEDVTGWRVLVGPRDSGRIPGWMEEHWPPESL